MKIYSGKHDVFGFESDDCAVRCLANLSGMSYHEAHTELRRVGRKNKQSTSFDVYYPVYQKNNIKMISIHGESEEAFYLADNLTSVPYYEDTVNIAFLIQNLDQSKSYAILTKDHVFAFIKGVIYDKSAIGTFEEGQFDEAIGVMEMC